VQGTVSGSTLNFFHFTLPAGSVTVTVANVRVNASALTTGSGTPQTVSMLPFISGMNLNDYRLKAGRIQHD